MTTHTYIIGAVWVTIAALILVGSVVITRPLKKPWDLAAAIQTNFGGPASPPVMQAYRRTYRVINRAWLYPAAGFLIGVVGASVTTTVAEWCITVAMVAIAAAAAWTIRHVADSRIDNHLAQHFKTAR